MAEGIKDWAQQVQNNAIMDQAGLGARCLARGEREKKKKKKKKKIPKKNYKKKKKKTKNRKQKVLESVSNGLFSNPSPQPEKK